VPEGEYLFSVVDEESPFEVEAMVGQRNFDLLEVGGPVRMKSQVSGGLFGEKIRGTIAELPIVPETEGQDGPLYEVEISVDSVPFPLVPGSAVEVEFVHGQRTLIDAILASLRGSNTGSRLRQKDEGTSAE
jgi:hypothetical protein